MSDAIDPEAVTGLATKLGDLDLTPDERALLDGLLERAAEADADVEGYGVVFEVETTLKSDQESPDRGVRENEWIGKVARATGADLSALGVWTDMRP